ncbi:nuclear pore complex protein DDB_G0274915-like isoform X2 [Clytia hemisphaerica]
MVGNNSLSDALRCLTCGELFLFCEYYSNHPLLKELFSKHSTVFHSFNSLLGGACVSDFSQGTNLKGSALIKAEAKHNSSSNVFSSFLCICALSTVTRRKIITFYPDQGLPRYKILFNNTTIIPRVDDSKLKPFKILFCNLSDHLNSDFQPNHFVPLVNLKESKKTKTKTKKTGSLPSCSKKQLSKPKRKFEAESLSDQPPSKQLKFASSVVTADMPSLSSVSCSNPSLSSIKKSTSKAKGDMLNNPTLFNYFTYKKSLLESKPPKQFSVSASPRRPLNSDESKPRVNNNFSDGTEPTSSTFEGFVPSPITTSSTFSFSGSSNFSFSGAPKPTCGASEGLVTSSTPNSNVFFSVAPEPTCGASEGLVASLTTNATNVFSSGAPKPTCGASEGLVASSTPNSNVFFSVAPKPTCGASEGLVASLTTNSTNVFSSGAPKPTCGVSEGFVASPTRISFSDQFYIREKPSTSSISESPSNPYSSFFEKRTRNLKMPPVSRKVTLPPTILENISTESKFDIGTYFSKAKSLSETEIFDLITNVFSPDPDFKFPKPTNGRKFRADWLSEHQWLKYSPSRGGGFCLPCSLFSHCIPSTSKGVMISKPILPSANTKAALRDHETAYQGIHSFSFNAFQQFISNYEGKSKPIDSLLEAAIAQRDNHLRQILVPIVDTVLFLGRRGLALRGHRDSSDAYPEAGCYSKDPGLGNFIDLLNYGIRRGDTVLKEHYENHPKNASYMSYPIQNEIIDCIGEIILETILNRVKEAKFFSVLADEAMDASKKEQLSIVLRYIHDNKIYEDFSGFVHLKDGLTGKHLADAILEFIEKLGLDYKDIRGQGYDGAGAVAG